MKLQKSKLSTVLEAVRKAVKAKAGNLTFIHCEDDFVMGQLRLKLGKDFEVRDLDSLDDLKTGKRGLFKPTVGVLYFDSEMDVDGLRKAKPQVPVIVALGKDDLENAKLNVMCHSLAAFGEGDLTAAFTAWLNSRSMQADPEAIKFALDYLSPADLKPTLEMIGFRDNFWISLPAVQAEFQTISGNLFGLLDSLVNRNRLGVVEELDKLLAQQAPQQLLAALTTNVQTIMYAMQGKQAGASADQIAEVTGRSPGALRHALERVKSAWFDPVRLMLLFNTLIGLNLQLRRTSPDMSDVDTFKLNIYKYLAQAGYMGT